MHGQSHIMFIIYFISYLFRFKYFYLLLLSFLFIFFTFINVINLFLEQPDKPFSLTEVPSTFKSKI